MKAWLIHWGLILFFKKPHGSQQIVTLLTDSSYMNVIGITCRHILRYLVASIILNHNKTKGFPFSLYAPEFKTLISAVCSLIQQEKYKYQDSLTNFFLAIYNSFDFQRAKTILPQIKKVILYFIHVDL